MKTSIELIDEKNALNEKRNNIVKGAEAEQRKLSASEQAYFDELGEQVKAIDAQLEEIRSNAKKQKPQPKTAPRFSLIGAIGDVVNNRSFNDETAEMLQRGRNEFTGAGVNALGAITLPSDLLRRSINATTSEDGAVLVGTDVAQLVTPIYERSLLNQAGATFMGGLVGNVSIPSYSGSTVFWEGEETEAKDGKGTFDEITMTPHRISAVVPITKQLLLQSSQDIETALYNDIYNAVAYKLSTTAFGVGAGDSYTPKGLFYGVSAMEDAVTNADLIDMIAGTNNEIGAPEKFVISKSAMSKLMTTSVDAGSGIMLMGNGLINGYDVIASNNVVNKGVAFGNFAELVVGQWGGVDITVDPYTMAKSGKILLVVNAFFDIKVRRADAIKTAILA